MHNEKSIDEHDSSQTGENQTRLQYQLGQQMFSGTKAVILLITKGTMPRGPAIAQQHF
jgi:hypothetical protein